MIPLVIEVILKWRCWQTKCQIIKNFHCFDWEWLTANLCSKISSALSGSKFKGCHCRSVCCTARLREIFPSAKPTSLFGHWVWDPVDNRLSIPQVASSFQYHLAVRINFSLRDLICYPISESVYANWAIPKEANSCQYPCISLRLSSQHWPTSTSSWTCTRKADLCRSKTVHVWSQVTGITYLQSMLCLTSSRGSISDGSVLPLAS